MEQVRQLRGYLLAMLAGAGIMVLAQVADWPPEGRFEVAFAWFTAVVAVVAVSLALYEWWRGGGDAGHPVRSSRAHTRRRANSGQCIRTENRGHGFLPPFDPPGTSRIRVGAFLLALPQAILLIAALFSGAENLIMVLVFGIPSASVLVVTWGCARRLLYAVERIAYPEQPEPETPQEHYADPRYVQPQP